MRITRRHAVVAGALFVAFAAPAAAHAADVAADGTLVFAKDALATYGFESFGDLEASGAAAVTWSVGGKLVTTPLQPGDEGPLLTGAAGALEGRHALLLRQDLMEGVALRDEGLFQGLRGRRISVSFWGRAFGAEPVLQIVYARDDVCVGPGLTHVTAIRTGRETSDGWVEYATGPVDGAVWTSPLAAVVLTARYATDRGASLLTGTERSPRAVLPSRLLDPDAYAVIDAVEVRPAPGSSTDGAPCTQATVGSACGASGECQFGHCIDGSVVWGAVPQAADHRADLVARWAFVAESLHANRRATGRAAAAFDGAAATLSGVESPREYYGKLNELVLGLRDSHTVLGSPPSLGSVSFPLVDAFSGPLDVCFGLARNDLAGDEPVFAIFRVGANASVTETLEKGDVLTAVDGLAPSVWLAGVLARYLPRRPSDPAADPSHTALYLSKLLGRYARTLTFSRCQAGRGCTPLPDIPIADEVFRHVAEKGGYVGSTLRCTPRFHPAVSRPPPEITITDQVVAETVNGVTSVQFDGFQGAYDPKRGYAAWEDPMTRAFSGGSKVLVDARLGHGGKFVLGRWLFRLLRGTDQPYGMFAAPRGAYDDPDPAWLFAPRWDTCAASDLKIDACLWAGGQTSFTVDAAPAGEGSKIAWVNGDDASMNDIVPRLLAGRSGFRVFGPHPTQGAYGEVSYVPPIEPSWSRGSIQVLDMRFGATPAAARAGAWESGVGVAPDEVVVQTVSDILMDQDTALNAARVWVDQ